MKRLFKARPSSSAVPSVLEGESPRTPTHPDALAAVNKVLDVAEKAVDGLPIPGLKQVISTIHAILQSVEVKVIDYLCLGWRLLTAICFFLRNQKLIKGR